MSSALKIAVVIIVVLTLAASLARAGTKPVVKKSSIPESVLQAFEESYPNAKVVGYDSETIGKQTMYEIETAFGRIGKDYIYLEDGTLVQIEQEIYHRDIPDSVFKAIKKAYPKGEIGDAEKITRGKVIEYSIDIKVDEQELEVLVSPDGTILRPEEETGEDEDDDVEEDEDDDDDDDD
jgi:hypothetical protein